MPFDAIYEFRIARYRKQRRLMLVQDIDSHAPKAAFEAAFLQRLTQPQTATFFWQEADRPGRDHRGFVMVAFTKNQSFVAARNDLQGFQFNRRNIVISKAPKKTVSYTHKLRIQFSAEKHTSVSQELLMILPPLLPPPTLLVLPPLALLLPPRFSLRLHLPLPLPPLLLSPLPLVLLLSLPLLLSRRCLPMPLLAPPFSTAALDQPETSLTPHVPLL
jgi:hypothetical protein